MKNLPSPPLWNARLSLALLLAAVLSSPVSQGATTANTDPVGFVKLNCLGNSDSIMSMPVYRSPVYMANGTPTTSTTALAAGGKRGGSKGAVAVMSTVTNSIAFSGTPFVASQYKHVTGTQPDTYYALMTSGTKAGSFYTILDNDTSSVTIDLNGDDLSGVTSAVPVKIIPYWTLNTVFPGGTGVTASSGFTTATQIIVPNSTGAGINLASSEVYYYSSGAAAWYNSATSAVANEAILYPDRYFIVRNNGAAATSFVAVGAVALSTLSIPVATSAAGQQDNPVAITRPVAVSLNDSGLISSGVFSASSGFTAGDQLLVFDNTVPALNKAATTVYTYVSGAWQRSDGTSNTGADLVFTPGTGVIIRKATNAGGATLFWINPATYTNN